MAKVDHYGNRTEQSRTEDEVCAATEGTKILKAILLKTTHK